MKHTLISLVLAAALVACADDTSKQPHVVDKADAFGSKADTDLQRRICRQLGHANDCDVCAVSGWYGDGECDTFCNAPDPDCGALCQFDNDCPRVYCITTPCPQRLCVDGTCQVNSPCFGAWVDETGTCRSSNHGEAPSACCSCEGAVEYIGLSPICLNKHDVAVAQSCCDPQSYDGGTDPDCFATGCSGQICSDQSVATTCEFRREYGCYTDAICERQADGQCGWTDTPELQRCLEGDSP